MVNVSLALKIVGIIGNLISMVLFLSPAPTFWRIWKKKDVEEFSPIPYLATLLNCCLWVFYGLPFVSHNNTLLYSINGFGCIVEATYLILFFLFSQRRNKMKILRVLGMEGVFIGAVIGVVSGGIHTKRTRNLIVGVFADIFGVIMYASPLTVMRDVIRRKSVEYMPFSLSVVGFLNAVCWTTYALLKLDKFVLIPNGIGTVLGLSQLILYFCYYPSTTQNRSGPNESVDESTTPAEDEPRLTSGAQDNEPGVGPKLNLVRSTTSIVAPEIV